MLLVITALAAVMTQEFNLGPAAFFSPPEPVT
jgi:hypothetical protein